MIDRNTSDVQTSYDLVADEYVRRIFDELEHKPLDRELLDRFASRVQGRRPVCDLGCGPGHVARYLHGRGVQVVGIDLSPMLVAQARKLNPGIQFQQGNMRALDIEDGAFGRDRRVLLDHSHPASRGRRRPGRAQAGLLHRVVYCSWLSTLAMTSCTWTNGGDKLSRSTSSSSGLMK